MKTVFAIIGLLSLAGCTTPRSSTPGAGHLFHAAAAHDIAPLRYVVDPPDEITILAPGIGELNGQKQTVSQEGTVTFNLLGAVTVAGQTPDEIADRLKQLVSRYYSNPEVKVVVTAHSKFYYVFGKGVNSTGPHAYTGRDTVVHALAQSGLSEGGWPEQVRVSRPARGNRASPETAVVDFTQVFERGDLKQNFLLEEGDIIYVPDTPLHALVYNIGQVTGAIGGSANLVQAGTAVRTGAP